MVQYSNRLELRPNHDLLLDIVRRQSKIYFSIPVQRVGLRLGLQVQFGLRKDVNVLAVLDVGILYSHPCPRCESSHLASGTRAGIPDLLEDLDGNEDFRGPGRRGQ